MLFLQTWIIVDSMFAIAAILHERTAQGLAISRRQLVQHESHKVSNYSLLCVVVLDRFFLMDENGTPCLAARRRTILLKDCIASCIYKRPQPFRRSLGIGANHSHSPRNCFAANLFNMPGATQTLSQFKLQQPAKIGDEVLLCGLVPNFQP